MSQPQRLFKLHIEWWNDATGECHHRYVTTAFVGSLANAYVRWKRDLNLSDQVGCYYMDVTFLPIPDWRFEAGERTLTIEVEEWANGCEALWRSGRLAQTSRDSTHSEPSSALT